MNLTILFVVLSIGIGYLIYDSFKKSRQIPASSTKPASKLKINYQKQCVHLKSLHNQKMDNAKLRSFSFHFNQYSSSITTNEFSEVKAMLRKMNNQANIYLLVEKDSQNDNEFAELLRTIISPTHVILYRNLSGAVAVLRQLNCDRHFQADSMLFNIVKQYLSDIWIAGIDANLEANRAFKTETQMMLNLENCISSHHQQQ